MKARKVQYQWFDLLKTTVWNGIKQITVCFGGGKSAVGLRKYLVFKNNKREIQTHLIEKWMYLIQGLFYKNRTANCSQYFSLSPSFIQFLTLQITWKAQG